MGLFGPLDTSASGMRTYQTWLDTAAANIANMDDTARSNQTTYAEETVLAQSDSTVAPAWGRGGETSGITSCVSLAGEWQGSVLVHCNEEAAYALTAALFMLEPHEVTADEVADAIGEVANIIGGNLKGLLPEPTTLSIPAVTSGESYRVKVPNAVVDACVEARWPQGTVTVTVWRV